MLNLDLAKLVIIAVVAVVLLGPERLPEFARQVGATWRSFNEYRHRMETQVRQSLPDLPSTAEIARLTRSPTALLDHLSTMSPRAVDASAEATPVDPTAGSPPAGTVPAPSSGHVTSAPDPALN